MHLSSRRHRRSRLLAGTAILGLTALFGAAPALAGDFDISAQPLPRALAQFGVQSGFEIIADSTLTASKKSGSVLGNVDPDVALSHILRGTGLTYRRDDGSYVIVAATVAPRQLADTTSVKPSAGIESVVVTSSKIKGDIQTVPIAITALSQEQLTSRQIAGGPDLVKEVPNLTFSKTNFTGYNIQIRGIGTQAISVTTDPAVAVALNDIPFIRNHFFEQEFFDVNQVEVLRGPQGTLYGRNATAGVVNVITAKPTDQFEAMLSADWGNYENRRYEGMVNIPIVDDRVDLRVAGEWTKRNGYSFNEITNQPIDGRDLWSSRVTLRWRPSANLDADVVWEHFSEDDDRLRSGKQLCKTVDAPTSVDGIAVPSGTAGGAAASRFGQNYLSQSCGPVSLYSPDAFEVPYGFSLPYETALSVAGIASAIDPYSETTQSRNLRVIESTINPSYRAKNDTLELNVDYNVTPALSFTSQTGYNQDFLWSTEDYNRFTTAPGIFAFTAEYPDSFIAATNGRIYPDPNQPGRCYDNTFTPGDSCGPGVPAGTTCQVGSSIKCLPAAIVCDPQLGCSDRIVAEDLSEESAWQLSQEFRLASNFSGPLNFSVGGNYMHYETEESYYVFINALSAFAIAQGGNYPNNQPNPGDNSNCLTADASYLHDGYQYNNPSLGGGVPTQECVFIDVNPISSLNNEGHNYFLSQNPYVLNSYAGFGEVYYKLTDTLKLTGGLRWTEDKKHFVDIPSEVLTRGMGYDPTGIVNQQWGQLTGRSVVDWTPKLDFTDQTLIYGSFAHGYKAGGANPPGAVLSAVGAANITVPVHPLTFKPEFINAYELGSKNTLLDGAVTLNGTVFYYDYKDYQISEIVDRTSINLNFNATVKGAELETSWEPVPGLKFSFAGGYEDTRINNGQSAIDLMDRTDAANHPGWMVIKPFVTDTSNCILPDYVVAAMLQEEQNGRSLGVTVGSNSIYACDEAYDTHFDPATLYPYQANPTGLGGVNYVQSGGSTGGYSPPFPIPAGYPGFDPTNPAINNGEGFAKNLGGNQLPNAPHFTTSLSAEYTIPVSENWAATLHSDFYWQSQSFARVFNDRPYDKIRGYSNVNLALILTSASGWQVMGYLKNVFNTTAITGDFLNSDDSGLTTNIFLTDPRLFGVRVTKNF